MRRFLIDENLPAGLANALRVDGVPVENLGLQWSDDAIWDFAVSNDLVILTKDADFFDKLSLKGAPPKVVWVRTGNLRRADLQNLLVRIWPRVISLLEEADLIEIHHDRLEALKF